jgi:hypothetical protein
MRVFKLADGTSWVARLNDGPDAAAAYAGSGWEAILFEASPHAIAQRLVYRPPGWLGVATPEELAAALEEGLSVRARWGGAPG